MICRSFPVCSTQMERKKAGMKCVIFAGLPAAPELHGWWADADYVIAADAGYENACRVGVEPDLLLGDYDSAPRPEAGAKTVFLPAEKDDTDTYYAARKALELAEEKGLDLVKISPNAKPPVCKLMDYDKHRYEQAKRERELRKNQRVVELKEVQLSATIEENDVQTKAKTARRFLEGGDKVKVSIRFRGRQITHSDIGMKVMQDFAERTKDVSTKCWIYP